MKVVKMESMKKAIVETRESCGKPLSPRICCVVVTQAEGIPR
jgi:hypothetical protein